MERDIQSRVLSDVIDELIGTVEERKSVGGVDHFGMPTGFALVDLHTGGMRKDELWIIAGRTSSGKTAAALSLALETARNGKNAYYYSLEMSAQVLVNRLLSSMTGINAGKIIRGKIDDRELKLLKAQADLLKGYPLFIVDSSLTSLELMEHAQNQKEHVPDLVVVDYASLLRDPDIHGETQRASNISSNLRALGRPDHLDIPVVMLAQLNRASQTRENQRPRLYDLKSTSSFEQDANVVLLLYRPHMEQRDKGADPKEIETDAEIIIAKNREGMVLSTKAVFYANTIRWEQK